MAKKIRKPLSNLRMNRFITKEKKFNILLASLIFAYAIFGVFVMLSASSYLTIKYNHSQSHYAIRQGFFVIVGFFAMILISFIDFRLYKKYAGIIWAVSIVIILLGLFTPLGVAFNGYARRSIKIGFISFMPSDLYKIASILFVAKFLIQNYKNRNGYIGGLIKSGLVLFGPTLLIALQPDLSTFISISLALGFMYLMHGMKTKFTPIVLAIFALAIFIFFEFGNVYQLDRIRGYLEPEKYTETISWQIMNSLYAVSRGGLFGVGYGKSVLKYGYLADEVINDMIFAVIGEEFGFLGSSIFIIAMFTIFLLIMRDPLKSKNIYAKLICMGIASLFLVQSMINIGVSTNLIPNTGLTLPFISNGGTSMLSYFVLMGIVLNISRDNYKAARENKL